MENNSISHLYILEGAKGIGKKTLSFYLSSMLHCEGQNKPCMECHHCIKHQTSNHPDLIIVKEKDKDKKSIGVDTVRGIISDLYIKPFLSDKKIYIIPDGETLSVEAQNALLKVLEEPPSHALIFLLTTSSGSLLQTVRSRGITLKIDGGTSAEIASYIEEVYPDKANLANLIATFSGGIMGSAIDMAEEGSYLEMRDSLYKLMPFLYEDNSFNIYGITSVFEKYKDNQKDLFNLFMLYLRDVLYVKLLDNDILINYDYKNDINNFALRSTADGIIKAFTHVLDAASKIGKGSNIALWINDLIINCNFELNKHAL